MVATNFAYTATISAVYRGQLSAVTTLLEQTNLPINSKGRTGNSPLMFAAEFNQYEIAAYLLQAGADFTLKNAKGDTALSLARKKGNTQIATLLLNSGAM